jgi:hypothetical protein
MADVIKFNKVISELPPVLEADAVYFVRTGEGFDMYVTDRTGSVAFRVNPMSPTVGQGEELFVVTVEPYSAQSV